VAVNFHVQRLDDGTFRDLPGSGDFVDSFRAIHAAQSYVEKSGQRARVVNNDSKTVWDSKTSMPPPMLD